jgi:hypothetical protein
MLSAVGIHRGHPAQITGWPTVTRVRWSRPRMPASHMQCTYCLDTPGPERYLEPAAKQCCHLGAMHRHGAAQTTHRAPVGPYCSSHRCCSAPEHPAPHPMQPACLPALAAPVTSTALCRLPTAAARATREHRGRTSLSARRLLLQCWPMDTYWLLDGAHPDTQRRSWGVPLFAVAGCY